MMKRFLILVGVAVVAAAMYVAASPASQQAKGPTAKQFSALKKQVASLSKAQTSVKKLAVAEAALLTACMNVAVPVDQFGDGQNQTQGYHYGQSGMPTSNTNDIFTTALDVSTPTDQGAVWFAGGGKFTNGHNTCGTALGENALGHAAAKAGIRLPHALLLHTSFRAHRP
jgi:hypothetical protein